MESQTVEHATILPDGTTLMWGLVQEHIVGIIQEMYDTAVQEYRAGRPSTMRAEFVGVQINVNEKSDVFVICNRYNEMLLRKTIGP